MNSGEHEPTVLIIGIGNVLRGDDGVGPIIAQRLEQLLPKEVVRVMTCHQLLPELAEDLSRVELAVFVDAACDLVPGEVRAVPIESVLESQRASTHDFSPPALLRLAKQLYGRSPRAIVVAVGAESFGYEQALSNAARLAVDVAVQRVTEIAAREQHDA
jgi:hydrogenase maturation protease